MKKIANCKEGDIVQHSGGNRYKVLARLNSLVFLSTNYDYDLPNYQTFTIMQFEKENWKLLTKDGRTPMSKKEIEHLMNIKIED